MNQYFLKKVKEKVSRQKGKVGRRKLMTQNGKGKGTGKDFNDTMSANWRDGEEKEGGV